MNEKITFTINDEIIPVTPCSLEYSNYKKTKIIELSFLSTKLIPEINCEQLFSIIITNLSDNKELINLKNSIVKEITLKITVETNV